MQKLTSKKTTREYDKDGKLLKEIVEETYTEEPNACFACPWYPNLATTNPCSDKITSTDKGPSDYWTIATTSLNG